jgi:hypothetical protein
LVDSTSRSLSQPNSAFPRLRPPRTQANLELRSDGARVSPRADPSNRLPACGLGSPLGRSGSTPRSQPSARPPGSAPEARPRSRHSGSVPWRSAPSARFAKLGPGARFPGLDHQRSVPSARPQRPVPESSVPRVRGLGSRLFPAPRLTSPRAQSPALGSCARFLVLCPPKSTGFRPCREGHLQDMADVSKVPIRTFNVSKGTFRASPRPCPSSTRRHPSRRANQTSI